MSLTAAKGMNATSVGCTLQSSADDFESKYRTPKITVTRDWVVNGNGKVQFTLRKNEEETRGCDGRHSYNDFATYGEQVQNNEVCAWKTNFVCNPEDERQVVEICLSTILGYSDLRAPNDFARYGEDGDHYGNGRVAYYNRYCEWRDAGYPFILLVQTAQGEIISEETAYGASFGSEGSEMGVEHEN